MSVAGALFWVGLVVAAVLVGVGQVVRNRVAREVLIAVALWTVIAAGLAGAAWATTAQS